ncbi:hypothetical protein [Succinivibrio dextrinosolvens]|uniref:hypothetical protein n=1 Tax=Succinivibrio dextrinosolvens TaxID=83771 RepID=UPI001924F7F8|nr:hypothetical protein [Succinivibrio dextrinosolvens]
MKSSFRMFFLISYALVSMTLTGCGENTAKLEPNNWYCRPDKSLVGYSASPGARLQRLELEHKIDDAQKFRDKCEALKLGYYSDEYSTLKKEEIQVLTDKEQLKTNAEKRKMLLAKWQEEAGVNPKEY